mmetsp:Transcript_52723/g.160257  ORF Transcript_52723/g.160257 Transcript_52723/m.160257 type:complete len:247 (-) Transcript_52723:1310-2050(-)
MSVTSSTPKTSRSSTSISMGFSSSLGASSPFSSAAFFLASARLARSAFLAPGFFQSLCSLRHAWMLLVHACHVSLNSWPGWRSSTRCVIFLAKIQSFRNVLHSASPCHLKTISSKPSSRVGNENSAYTLDTMLSATSGVADLRNFIAFSSSLSSITTSSSLASSLASSSLASSSLGSSPSFLASRAFLASSAFFRFSSAARFLSSSAAFLFLAASALDRLSAKMSSWTRSLYSAVGSPIATIAVFL